MEAGIRELFGFMEVRNVSVSKLVTWVNTGVKAPVAHLK